MELYSLKSQAYNGKRGTIVDGVADVSGRVQIRIDGNVKAIRAKNIRLVPKKEKKDSREAADAASMPMFGKGEEVVLHSLKSKVYNGKRGIVVKSDSGRVQVSIDGNVKGIRAANLRSVKVNIDATLIQSAGVVVMDQATQSVLCMRVYQLWDFPKGLIDSGESHIQGALRELEEETTLAEEDITLVGLHAPTITHGKGSKTKQATYFMAFRKSEKEPFLPVSAELGKPEHDEYRWVKVHNLNDLMPRRLLPVVEYVQKELLGS